MKVGEFEVPDFRLIPNAYEILEKIYKVKHRERIQSKDLAILLGYKYGTESHFYRRLKSLLAYGLLEGSGTYNVSELGENLLHPRSMQEKDACQTSAVLNVGLWKRIYEKHGKNPSEDNFWPILVDITKIHRDKAVSLEGKLYKWYVEDMAHVYENLIGHEVEGLSESRTEDLRSSFTQDNQMSQQQFAPPKLQNNQDNELIQFGKSSLSLPKKDLKKQWKKLQKYMEIFLEDYIEGSEKEKLFDDDLNEDP